MTPKAHPGIAVVSDLTCGNSWRFVISISVILCLAGRAFSQPFPGGLPGTEIGAGLPAGYEPSGACWHSGRNKLFLVHDGGTVSSMNANGSAIQNWNVGGDLEGICVADPASNFVYLGIEDPDSIREFNLITGQVTRSFDLTPWMSGSGNAGLEALTFVPNVADPEGGLFYAGLQSDGSIHIFRLPIRSSSTSTSVVRVGGVTPAPGRSDISGLDYDAAQDTLYAIWDGPNKIRALRPDGGFLNEWDLPGNDQEGIALLGCDLFIAEDVGKEVWRYSSFSNGDDDGDGVANCVDACPNTPSGAAVDATGCPSSACQLHVECDDGLYCNGLEQCVANQCQTGSSPCVGTICIEASNSCAPGVPAAPIAFAEATLWPRNRYISFQPGNPGAWVAFRVTKNTDPVGSCWVGVPDSNGRASCLTSAVFRVWTESVIHVGDCEIVPAAGYQISAASNLTSFSAPLAVMTVPVPVTNGKLWGDVVGPLDSHGWTRPDGLANVQDVLGVLSFIASAESRPVFEVVNLQSQSTNDPCLNNAINVGDVFAVVDAVRGSAYPFANNPSDCPPCP